MKYNKLVRDKIPEIIRQKGGNPTTHIAGAEEYWDKLKEKLVEEAKEFMESGSKEELADIFEVIDAVCLYKGFNKDELVRIQEAKATERGKFADKIILDES